MQHPLRFFHSLLTGGVCGMAFLPEELSRSQEQTGTHFPTDHVGPLVAQNRQIAVGMDPILIGIPDDGFRRGAHNQFLLQFGLGVHHHTTTVWIILQTVMGNHGTLLGEAFHVTGLTTEEGFRDKNREIGVGVARFLEHSIQSGLNLLPNRISVRFYHHTTSHRGIFSQISFLNNIIVPLRITLFSCRKTFCHYF